MYTNTYLLHAIQFAKFYVTASADLVAENPMKTFCTQEAQQNPRVRPISRQVTPSHEV